MATFAQEKIMRAHLELIAEGGDYADYFSQGTNESGEKSTWYLTNDSDKDAAQALLDARVATLTDIGSETSSGEGPSDFDGYTPIHFDDSVSGADYRTWFVDANGDYFKADNGNSDSIAQITDSDEINTLLTDSGYIAG
mgnify:FL=1|tara:strand:- start:129 stop:545 length:417 start_codon:yes stop_codon:yes gene_type:complete